jgi:hypothetical protein
MKQLRYCIAALLILAPITARTQVRQLGLQEIVQSAKTICVATVTNVKSTLDENKDVVTYTTFKLEETIAGAPQKTFKIKQIGGDYNGISHKLEHIRYFNKGERVVLTLYPNSQLGFTNPVGLNQGVWNVDTKNRVLVPADQLMSVKQALAKHSIQSSKSNQSIEKKNFVSLLKDIHATAVRGGSHGN